MAEFAIHPLILATTEPLTGLVLCDARLQMDSRWPWVVLSPRRPGAREIDHLAARDRIQLMDEIIAAGAAVRAMGAAFGRPVEKLNIGAIGNVVSQLHVHVIGRRPDDPVWPMPVWGTTNPVPYEAFALADARSAALPAFEGVRAR